MTFDSSEKLLLCRNIQKYGSFFYISFFQRNVAAKESFGLCAWPRLFYWICLHSFKHFSELKFKLIILFPFGGQFLLGMSVYIVGKHASSNIRNSKERLVSGNHNHLLVWIINFSFADNVNKVSIGNPFHFSFYFLHILL